MTATVPFIPETAPFSPEQRAWLNGFVAGLFSEAPIGVPNAGIDVATKATLTVLYGSQTGNAEGLAKQFLKSASRAGHAGAVRDLADFSVEDLAAAENVILITSTYGEGEPPDNAREFYDAVMADSAPRLEKMRFTVFGLGDSNYPDFCQAAVDLDNRLAQLGGQRLVARVDADVDFDEPFNQWTDRVLGAFDRGDGPANESLSAAMPASKESGYTRASPFSAPLLKSENLNGAHSAKETYHVEIDLADSGLEYAVGDALGVYPVNDSLLVDELINLLGFESGTRVPIDGGEMPLSDALTTFYDITKLTLPFARRIAELGGHETFAEICADKKAFLDYSRGREIIDVLAAYPVSWDSASDFVAELKKLAARLYSISSSPKAHPGQVHLTVGRVRYDSFGRRRGGICSNMLARASAGDSVRVFVQPNKHFRPPADPTCPMIMVGPGTGIAPFRAFLEERESTGARGYNWLFFGDQKASCDFLYAEQLDAWQKNGLLTRLDTAFSRDQTEKIYVQDRMRAAAAELVQWLDKGAYFFVCGDASRMAKDVDATLREVIAAHKGLTPDEVDAYMKDLQQAKRYVRDVY